MVKMCSMDKNIVGVEVNWVQAIYAGSEGNVISVCALHLEETQRDFTVNIAVPNTPGMRNLL